MNWIVALAMATGFLGGGASAGYQGEHRVGALEMYAQARMPWETPIRTPVRTVFAWGGEARPFHGLTFGGAQYISASDAAAGTFFDFGAGAFTIEFWMSGSVDATSQRLIARGQANNDNSWRVYFHADTKIVFQVFGDFSGSSEVVVIVSDAGVGTSTQTHVAVTRDGSGNLDMYFNGVSAATTVASAGFDLDINETVFIGSDRDINDFYTGTITQLRVTKGSARTATQIAISRTTSTPIGYETVFLRFDDGTGTVATDAMGNVDFAFGAGDAAPSWTVRDISLPPTRF